MIPPLQEGRGTEMRGHNQYIQDKSSAFVFKECGNDILLGVLLFTLTNTKILRCCSTYFSSCSM